MSKRPKISQKEQRMFRWRVFAFVVLHLLIGIHLYLWYAADWHVIGAIDMQELFRNTIEKNILTVGALFFLALIGLGLIWGRFFCGWFCHIGQAYDLLAVLYRKLHIPIHHFPTRFGPLAAGAILLGYFLWEAVVNRFQQPPGALQIDWGLTEPWELLPGWLNGSLTLALVLLVLPILLGRRAFCRNLCPWGVLLGAMNKVSALKVRRTGDCAMCGACSAACPMDIDVSREINTRFHVGALSCTNCLQCVASCPTNALTLSLPQRENRTPQTRPFLKALEYPTLSRELIFWVMTGLVGWIYAELYGIGIFMAFCLGLCLARITDHFVRGLPRISRIRGLGAVLVLILAWTVVAKDGFAKYHHEQGMDAFHRGDYQTAQTHYEWSDRLLWKSSQYELYHLYIIYKQTGQEEKRKELFERHKKMRESVRDN